MSRRCELKGSLPADRQPRDGQPQERPEFTFSTAIELLRQSTLRVNALTHAADELHEQIPWTEDKEIRRLRERLGHLIGDAADLSDEIVDACSLISEEFIKRPSGS